MQCAALEYDLSQGGVEVKAQTLSDKVSLAKDFILTITLETAERISMPDLRDRFQGFRVAEDFEEDPEPLDGGKTRMVSRWRLVPEPGAKRYRLAPFAVGDLFWTKPIVFEAEPLPPVTGDIEINPQFDPPPFSWRLAGIAALWCVAAAAGFAILIFTVRRIRTLVRIHRMSPQERARWELDELLKKQLPQRGRYKDFYVELTMVVRRYISRQHGIKAPQLTTGEFLLMAQENPAFPPEAIAHLKRFLESADLVKFAGLEATEEMASDATARARDYIDTPAEAHQ